MKYPLSEFGTAAHPLRASALPRLLHCTWRVVMEWLAEFESESGAAADTGSAVHFAAHVWHKHGKDAALAVEVMRRGVAKFPRADLAAAATQFLCYANDPRNRDAEVIRSEQKVQVTLEAQDPAQEEVVIFGTLDQVRRDQHGRLAVYDIKTGSPEGWDMLHEHALQLCAYQVGASALLGEPVHEAYIIRTKDYLKRTPGPVFWQAPWSAVDARELLRSVVDVVARVRSGLVHPAPGESCKWCPAGGVAGCLPMLRDARGEAPASRRKSLMG